MDVRLKGYVRCSTREQSPDRQIIALREFEALENDIVIEMKSGKNFNRPMYQRGVVFGRKPMKRPVNFKKIRELLY